MKKYAMLLIAILLIVGLFVLTGCRETETVENTQSSENNTNDVNTVNNEVSQVEIENKVLEVLNKDKYNDDLPLGFEFVDLTVNGAEVRVQVDTSGNSENQANGPYYINYCIGIKGNTVKEGKYHLEGYGIEMLKNFDIEEDIGTNYEFFERDFIAKVYKGVDKEYIAISIPAGIENEKSSSLVLSTDDGKLLGDLNITLDQGITLTGDDAEKYKDKSGNYVLYSIEDGEILYLTPAEGTYTTDANGKITLKSASQTITLEEHSITINNDKITDTKTNNTYTLTNSANKTLKLYEFNYLK